MSLETNIPKKSCFLDDKSFWPNFPCIIESDIPHESNDKSPHAILKPTVDLIVAFFKDIKCC